MMRKPGLKRHTGGLRRRGLSLLEVTVGSMMAAMLAVAASGVAYDLSRHMSANIAETQLAREARMAIESLRRDFGGSLPDQRSGEAARWRLVGRLIPSSDELRLCFDADLDATADWIAPDRVITYVLQDDQLQRLDPVAGGTFTVARFVDSVEFVVIGNEIRVTLQLSRGDAQQTYTFVTADLT